MPDWSEAVEQLLFDGEAVETSVDAGTATVVVTTHRVLAFTPQLDGSDYRALDRPNVHGVHRRSVDRIDLRAHVAKIGVAGAVLVLAGVLFDPGALIPRPDVTSEVDGGEMGDVGGVVNLVDGLLGAFHALDGVLLVVGGLLVAAALALGGIQLATRENRIAIEVAGSDDPLLLPDRIDDEALAALQRAVAPPDAVGGEPPNGPEAGQSDRRGGDQPADADSERTMSRDAR